jgi:hypothetical protein
MGARPLSQSLGVAVVKMEGLDVLDLERLAGELCGKLGDDGMR